MQPPELPKGWESRYIRDLTRDVLSGFACSRKKAATNGAVHLRTHNIGLDGQLDLSTIVRIPKELVDTSIFCLKAGDVLFNNTNSVELVGKTALVREDLPFAFSNHITRLRPETEIITSEWLALALRRMWQEGYFKKACRRWIGQAGFNPGMLATVELPVPPLDQQRRIVARTQELFGRIDRARTLHREVLAEFRALTQAILAKAFRGEL